MNNKPIELIILEDSPDDLELICLELEKSALAFNMRHAESGEAFERLLDQSLPQIVLSDYNIPNYDIHKARAALQEKDFSGVFILITGALGDEQAVDLIVNYGVNDYILKDNLSRLNPAIQREHEKALMQQKLVQKNEELQKLSLVASHTHNGVIITNANGTIEWVNEGYTRITGYTLQESVGRKPGDMLQGQDTSSTTVKDIAHKLEQTVAFTEEILNYDKQGEPYWIKLDITPILDEQGEVRKFIAIQEEITERKQKELALQEKTSQLNDIITNLDSVILKYALYTDGRQSAVYISDGLEGLFGIKKDEALEDLGVIFSKVHPDDLAELKQSILTSAKHMSAWDHTYRYLEDDGRVKYLRGKGIPHKKDDGTVIWNTIMVDETKRVKEEQQKNEFENLLKSSLNEIYIFDAESLHFHYCNRSALENIGYSKEEMDKMTPLDLQRGHNKNDFAAILRLARQLKSYSYETMHTRKDGSTYNVLVDLRFDNYKGKDVYMANVLDTTELVSTRKQLTKAQRFSQLAVEGAEVGLWELDLHTLDTYYNSMYYTMLGYQENEVTFTKEFHNAIIHPDDHKVIEEHMEKILSGEERGFREKIRLKAKDGSYRWILDKAKVVEYDDDGKPVKLAGSHLDITELENALQEKDVLIQEIHHRVKNNLAIISGLIELQVMKDKGEPQQGLVDTRNRIHAIATVHEQLYNTESFSDIVLDQYFESLIAKTMRVFSEDSTDIKVEFESKIDSININQAVPMGLLVNELLTNSIKHAFPEGGGTIRIAMEPHPDCAFTFSYEDSGPGFDTQATQTKDNFGLELIETLIHQLADDFILQTDGMFKLQFKGKNKNKGSHSNL